MELIADTLLVAGALGAGLYCFVLSRRLKRFTDLEQGVGGAVAVLSIQAEELKKSLDNARAASDRSGDTLQDVTERAQSVAQRLELMMASMHDVIPDGAQPAEPAAADDSQAVGEQGEQEPEQVEKPVPRQKPEAASESGIPTNAKTATNKTETNKVPEGLMFFRHDRARSEPAE